MMIAKDFRKAGQNHLANHAALSEVLDIESVIARVNQ
jgi:hypothetical protein